MSYTPIPHGTPDWDVPVNSAFTDQDGRIAANEAAIAASQSVIDGARVDGWFPSDYGLLGWTYDPNYPSGVAGVATTTMAMIKLKLNDGTVSALGVSVSTVGSGLTAGQNFLALYDVAGNLIGQTADQSAAWTTTGYKQASLITPVAVTQGYYYAAILSNGTTPPLFLRGANLSAGAGLLNLSLSASDYRFSVVNAAGTTPPATVNLGARTASITAYWMSVA
jgi:hypothetical protein